MAVLPNEIFINVDRGFQSQEDGKNKIQNGQEIKVTLSQNPIWGLTCLKDDGTAQTFDLTDTFSFVADTDFNVATTEPLRSGNSEFNVPGDWVSLDVVNGLISVRIDANTAELQTKLGTTKSEITMIGELQVFAAAATEPYIISRFTVIARNIVDQSGVVPPPIVSGFYSSAQVDSLLAGKEPLSLRGLAVSAFDATATPSVSIFTADDDTLLVAMYFVMVTLTGSVTTNFNYSLGITGDLTKFLNAVDANLVDTTYPEVIDLGGLGVMANLDELILTINSGSDATTSTVRVLVDAPAIN